MTSPAPASRTSYNWKFFRAGGFDQVRLDTGADLLAIDRLDQKLWVALACPTRGIEFDTVTLDLIDSDKDGRIRAPELIAAVKWAGALLKDPNDLLKGTASIPLASINDSTAEGKQIIAASRQILTNLGKPNATSIALEDTTDTAKFLAQTNFNGDGVVPADAANDPALKAVIADIVTCTGGTPDRSGKSGVNEAILTDAWKAMTSLADWAAKGEDKTVSPLAGDTGAASEALESVKVKINDYFSRCRLAAFDARALSALNRSETEYLTFAAKDLSIDAAEIAGFPLARIEAGKPLPLRTGVNPAWDAAISKFNDLAVKPVLGAKDHLTEAEWTALCSKLAAYDAWAKAKPATKFESLGIARVREILNGKFNDAILELIAKDKALAGEFSAISSVDQLVRYHRDLHRLATNFVNFKDFYDNDGEAAVFQSGTLYLDQRSCNLCIRVEDMGRHGAMAGLSKTYLVYCDLARKATGEKMTIAAAFTDGDSDNLMIGRNGIFYDRKGRDWDATISKIVEHPISIRQAFWLPYKKVATMIESQIEKFAQAREKAVHEQAAANIDKAAKSAETAATAPPDDKAKDKKEPEKKDAFDVGKFAGIFAAIGLAIGAIGTVIGSLIAGFLNLELWQMPLAIFGIMLVISGPSMLIAWLKLRQRNLGPILDANGWAVNSKAKVNIPFGRSLTNVAKLPPGAQTDMTDRFADSNSGRKWLILAAVLFVVFCVWKYGVIKYVGDTFKFDVPGYLYYHKPEPVSAKPAADAPGANEPAKK